MRFVGINNGALAAATTQYVTTQNIANLNTTSASVPASPLVGTEAVYVQGTRPDGYAAATLFATTTQDICNLGSIALSTLTGKEIIECFSALTNAKTPAGPAVYVTTLQVAG